MLLQLVDSKDRIAPPAIGAIIGATALITIKSAKNFVSSLPLNTSRTTARDRTTPAEAVNPCKKRAAINMKIFGDKAHRMEAAAKRKVAINKGFLLPRASLIGPITNWPNARPNKQAVKLDCTSVALVCKSLAIPGKLGKYISIFKGPKKASSPKSIANAKRVAPVGLCNKESFFSL